MPNMSVSDALFQIKDHLLVLQWVSCNGSESDPKLWCLDPEKIRGKSYLSLKMAEEMVCLINKWVYIRDHISETMAQMPDLAMESGFPTDLMHIMNIDDQTQKAIGNLMAKTDIYNPIFSLQLEIDDTKGEHKKEIGNLRDEIDNIKSDHSFDVEEFERKVAVLEEESEKLEDENEKLEKRVEELEYENDRLEVRIDELQSN